MKFLGFLLPVFSFLLLAAHFSRASQDWVAALCLLLPFLFLIRKKWLLRVLQSLLVVGGIEWLATVVRLVNIRMQVNIPYVRMAIILGVVALFTMLSAIVLQRTNHQARYRQDTHSAIPGFTAFWLTGLLLALVKLKVSFPILLLDRFWPGSGWVEVFLLALYAGWLAHKFIFSGSTKTPGMRNRMWLFFSVVFFAQLAIGLAGFEKFLMSGKLHLPVPAMILAGPLFRGVGFFMPILFAATLLLVGPAWCSHLCYIGSWDNALARGKSVPQKLPPGKNRIRLGIFILVVLTALALRLAGAPGALATGLGLGFGLLGVGVMVVLSRRKGVMTHCVAYCPMGLAANWLGKISPFRVRINDNCNKCMVCRPSCRYDALSPKDISKGKPGITCTLCGDCLGSCKEGALEYYFLGIDAHRARALFYILVVSLHAVFLGVARL